MIFQEPMTRLNPLMKISSHFEEVLRIHEPDMRKKEAKARALETLRGMGIPPTRYDQYPHEFSGGMRQRIMIALALVLRPAVIVADEPTTALDVLVEAQILRIIADLRRNFDTALLLITHNLGIVAEACDRVAVMYAGRVVEQGPAYDITTKPAHPYSRELLRSTISLSTTALHSIPGAPPDLVHPPPACRFHPRCPDAMQVCAARVAADDHRRDGASLGMLAARPRRHPRGPGGTARARGAGRRGGSMSATLTKTENLIEVRDLEVHFALHGTFRSRLTGRGGGSVKAVDGVSFDIRQGEVLGLVGESGSGKTTLGRALLGLVRPTGGSVKLQGDELAGLPERQLRPLRRRLQMVFQDPHASLNPAMTLETALAHPLQIHKLTSGNAETEAKVRETLELVGLAPVERFASSLPADLSGGQKQRAAIARSIIVGPDLLVADEPVSMLDMSVRAKILDLMIELKNRLGLTYVYVTHDLASAKFFCDRVAIMYLGRIVEIGTVEQIFAEPKHPYTQALIRAIPEPDPDKALPRDLPRGEVPDAASPPLGCSFHPRCPQAFGPCGWESRDLRAILDERWTNAGEEAYTTERGLFGDLEKLEVGHEALVPAGSGRDPGELVKMLEEIRSDEPDEPLWKGVKNMRAEAHGVHVTFEPGIDPELYDTGGSQAACLLYRPSVTGSYAKTLTSGVDRESVGAMLALECV